MPRVILGLGSNKAWNDSFSVMPAAVLDGAIAALARFLTGLRSSSRYETLPQGVTDQALFLNMAVSGDWDGSPYELLAAIQDIEARFGRDRARETRWGPRTLDIDILLLGGLSLRDNPVLEIPHPRLAERRFALEPLVELDPLAAEPGTGRLYRDIVAALPDQGVRRITPNR